MRITPTEGGKIEFFKALYEKARMSAEEVYENMTRNMEQYKGSKDIDESSVRAKHVRNITYELVESQVTSYIPSPTVTPKMWSEKNERNAKSIETMLCNKRNDLPFEKLNDMDERYNPIYGGSVWLVEWDNSLVSHSTVGDVKVTCLPPTKFTGQPNIYDIQDMEYCFVEFETTREDILRKYDVDVSVLDHTTSETGDEDDTATLYVCYYKDEDDKVCQYIWSGEAELSDIDDYFSRKKEVCKVCGKRKELCTCEQDGNKPKYEVQNDEFEEVEFDIPLSDGTVIPAMSEVIEDGVVKTNTIRSDMVDAAGQVVLDDSLGLNMPIINQIQVPVMEQTKLPYYTPTMLPIVIRKNTSQEDCLFGQSDCEFIRPQQQAINKVESRILEKIIEGGVFPIVPEDFSFDLDNTVFKRVFRARPETFNMFGRVDLSVDVSKDVAEAERMYDHAKRILGISDTFQGQSDSTAQSGKAKELQIRQSAGRLDSKRQMKNAAYAEMDKIIFQYYLAYADEPRPGVYKDANGRMQNIMFNRYDFLDRDESGRWYYNDEYLFAADTTMDIETNREALWQENRQNFQSGAYGDPSLPQTQLIFWQNMEKAHYPWAKDNVERIREEIERQNQLMMQQQMLAQQQAQIGSLEQQAQERSAYEDALIKQMGGMRNG
jgi:hypothetical protein